MDSEKMLSHSSLGSNGRLGNQMFQYAALRGITASRGFDYTIPDLDISLYRCFNIPKKFGPTGECQITHSGFEFDEELFENCPDNADLCGYFQSEKYFQNVEGIIRKEFTFCDRIDSMCSHYIEQKFFGSEVISVHIRRGDYLTDPNFYALEVEKYYLEALRSLPNCDVLVFSDDVEWAQSNFANKNCTISKSKNEFIDLCLMSKCDYHIIANSSFSWWGAWLAKSKKVIAPKKWFSGEFSNWNTKDLYLPDWIIL